jgi:putative heme-binding domain-containing protein
MRKAYFSRIVLGLLVLGFGVAAEAQPLIAETEWLSPQEALKTFHLPPGFEIQLVASEPEIQKPMNLAFDRHGRLLVTHSVEYPFPVGDDEAGRDGITVLEDIGADGRARKITRFAEGLNIPIGLTPLGKDDSLAVFSIPKIYRLTDTDGDGVADAKTEMYGSIGRADTHGMTSAFRRWLDGWIYACHGFRNDSEMTPAGAAPGDAPGDAPSAVVMNSGNTYRFSVDGTRIEQWTWGQVNPFGMAFDELGNLYTADCHTKPVYQILRGAYYPSFGKAHDGLGFGPAMIDHSHGSTGIAGIAYYDDDRFPEDFRRNIYIGNPITGRVHRDKLERRGSTYWADTQDDLVKSDDPWFRPVDVVMGPDGALYIADFYNRIIGHYEVPLDHPGRDRTSGRIWRVVYTGAGAGGASTNERGDVATMDTAGLIAALGDANLSVRTMATHELADRATPESVQQLRRVIETRGENEYRKAHAMWAMLRVGGLNAKSIELLAGDSSALVRVHVARLLSEISDWQNGEDSLALRLLGDEDAFVRRAAADALGRHAEAGNVERLLSLWEKTPSNDTHLIHTVRMALRDHLKALGYDAVGAAIQMDDKKQRRLADVSRGWQSVESAAFVLSAMEAGVVGRADLVSSFDHVAKHGEQATLAGAMEVARSYRGKNLGDQLAVLGAMQLAASGGGVTLSPGDRGWAVEATGAALTSGDLGLTRSGIALARGMRLSESIDALAKLAGRGVQWPSVRGEAMQALMAIEADGGLARLDGVIGDASEAMALRQRAVDLLGTRFKPDTTDVLVKHLRTAPRGLAITLAAALANSDDRARVLLDEIEAGRAAADLLANRAVEARMRRKTDAGIKERFERLHATAGDDSARVAGLIAQKRADYVRDGGDAARGKAVFDRACAACHEVAGAGGRIGPGLDGIGARGVERLLEDVLDPNRNVDEAFWLTMVQTTDGQVIAGLAGEEVGGELLLTDMVGQPLRVKVDLIKEKTVTRLSLMPPNMVDQLVGTELNDLLSYLMGLKEGGED